MFILPNDETSVLFLRTFLIFQFIDHVQLFNGPESVKPYIEKISERARKSFTFDAYRWCVSAVSTRQNEIPMGGLHEYVEESKDITDWFILMHMFLDF